MNSVDSKDIKEEIINFISEAYSETVKERYENFETASSNSRSTQERNFCYEFYCQMRNIQKSGKFEFLKNPKRIDAEIIKTDNPSQKIHRKQPDIIIHILGNNVDNLLVMEVKRIDAPNKNIKYDLEKLKDFIEDEQLKYKYGILLIFGKKFSSDINKIKGVYSKNDDLKLVDYIKNQKIMILWCYDESCQNVVSLLDGGNR